MIHDALRLLRSFHGMSQIALAKRLGISNSYLSEIESGKKKDGITVDLLTRYSEVFGIPVSSLMLFSENLDPARRGEKLRIAASAKILKLLDWIDEQEKISA